MTGKETRTGRIHYVYMLKGRGFREVALEGSLLVCKLLRLMLHIDK